MQLIRHLGHAGPGLRASVIAVGSFDGVHKGHQAVLARAAELGGSLIVGVGISSSSPALTSLRRRIRLLEQQGVKQIVLLARDESAAHLVARLGTQILVAGHQVPAPAGCSVDVVQSVDVDGRRVDSLDLVAALQAGDIEFVSRGLGRRPSVDGRVVHGFHRGAPLGIPTANLRIRNAALPPDGVYAVRARLARVDLEGVANLGFNPTFGNRARSVETHLLDFSGDIYSQRLEIAFVARLRGEQKFDSIDALLVQIRADIEAARAVFARSV